MSQNVKLKILNFTIFDIISAIWLFISQNISIWCIFMSKIYQNWFWCNSGWNIPEIIDSAFFGFLQSRIGFNFQFLWRLVVYILDFPKSVWGVTSDENFHHNRLSKSNFKYLVKQQFLIQAEIGRNIPKMYLLTNKQIW